MGARRSEYAVVGGLFVVGIFAVVSSVGTKVLAKWQSLDRALDQ